MICPGSGLSGIGGKSSSIKARSAPFDETVGDLVVVSSYLLALLFVVEFASIEIRSLFSGSVLTFYWAGSGGGSTQFAPGMV